MTAVMSYQYPLPTSRPDLGGSTRLANDYYPLPVEATAHPQTSAQPPSPTQSRSSPVSQKTGKMKHSLSTPSVRGQAASDAAAAEKRRNKLGYHRTSVACGHCRRRKIRCIPASDDSQNRCSNCIRLKKECNFFPVDQQPQPDTRNVRERNAQGGASRTSLSSSPSDPPSHLSELHSSHPYPHVAMPPIQDGDDAHLKRPRSDSFSPESKLPLFSRPHEYGQPGGWIPTEPSSVSSGTKAPSDNSSSYWRINNSNESPLTPVFSPFSPSLQLPHQQNWPPVAPEQSPREDMGWTVPSRSMSYGSLEGMPHPAAYPQYQQPSAQSNREDFTSRGAHHQETYMPTLASTSTGLPGPPITAIDSIQHTSGPAQPPQYSVGQGWQPYPPYTKPSLPSSSEGYAGGWYASDHQLPSQPHVSESGMAPVSYGHGEPYGSMYYPNTTQAGR